jgi:prepilin-type N-terminal cleavage/methylation domain-containing protein
MSVNASFNLEESGNKTITGCNGFTLIEILLVLFLMVLILSITTIYFANTLPAARLRATAREMSAAIKYAKYLALAKNEKQSFEIDFDSKTYSISGRERKNISPEISITVLDTNSNIVQEGKFSVVFDMRGGTDWKAITLAKGEKKMTIAMDPVLTAIISDGKKNENNR